MAAPYAWLVHSHGENNGNHTFSSITSPEESHFRRFPHSRHEKFWVSCNDGWSLSSDADHRHFFLWNIVQQKKITLPPLMNNFRGYISHCTLTSPPTKPDCTILLSATDTPLIFCLHLGDVVLNCDRGLGDRQWIEINYTDEVIKRLNNNLEIITPLRVFSCNGGLYAQTRFSRLLLIEKLDPSYGRLVLKSLRLSFPGAPDIFEPEVRGFLAEFQGKIYWILFRFGVVKEDEEVIDVDVHGLDLSKMVWKRIEHAPDLVFFVHETSSFCCRAIEPEIHGNRIYFSSNKILCSYHIGDKTLSAKSLHLPEIMSPYSSFWIMPDQSIRDESREEKIKGASEISNVAVKKSEEEETKDGSYLPFDIAEKVADFVDDFVDFLHLRASHSVFRSIPIPRHLNKTTPSLYSPWLILQRDCVWSMIDTVCRDSYFIKLPNPPLSISTLCFARKGWLLMSGRLFSSHLFNPFTRQLVPFPKKSSSLDGRRLSRSFMAFSDYPSADCLALEVNKFCDEHFEICCARLCDGDRWRRILFPSRDEQFQFYDNHPVFFRGEFYILGHCGKLVAVKFRQNGAISWNVFRPEKPCSYQQNFLVECNGQLWGVFVGRFGERVGVFEFKAAENAWRRIENLGNCTIFISRCSSVAAMPRIPGMENRIYFPRFCGETGYDVVFYSLETNKFHSCGTKDSEVDFCGTRELLNAAWIQPA
ncbi:hypothetical protein V6N13_141364 [Hibiscus sabdariffa]|uniref:KIB1-4 beta-propeller domain-containing protein n=1 Tax=Hibiscus sabdariffa TaxID=183260 RepID=A0ABR2P4S2_9ROSI